MTNKKSSGGIIKEGQLPTRWWGKYAPVKHTIEKILADKTKSQKALTEHTDVP